MKTVVIDRDLLELEIKPDAKLEEYRRLTEEDGRGRLLTAGEFTPCPCPGCRSTASRVVFEKSGMAYLECDHCRSVYVSPRPPEEALVDFYRNSRSARFWREQILPAPKETRRAKVFGPRAQWVLNVLDRYRPGAI